ncbi:hypothetical protein BDA99DRAFT_538030 [Phascolomyces articulosus]|uniref:Heterokaryon incompatibility domain-containing protein n=1 Tax=Phascolomyces articulosus TaxID=60185 RepID=A0AAD5PDS9_9FUNG|nr:hypothetical protein BDA99DRAFT_538030 [Phascolomyces articulosus]
MKAILLNGQIYPNRTGQRSNPTNIRNIGNMNYVTYCRNQTTIDIVDTTQYHLNVTAGKYRPTFLIRVSDRKRVPGKEAKDGYCALSYIQTQSGKIVEKENGEFECIDDGHHRIIEGYDMDGGEGDFILLASTEEQEYIPVMVFGSLKTQHETRTMSYDELLQQICKDFKIEYLWYDKICIDPSDNEIKQREIKQIHRIYSNACYTVAIVPEVHVHDPREYTVPGIRKYTPKTDGSTWSDVYFKSRWWKRS